MARVSSATCLALLALTLTTGACTGEDKPSPAANGGLQTVGHYGGDDKGKGQYSPYALAPNGDMLVGFMPDSNHPERLMGGTTQMGWRVGEEVTPISVPKSGAYRQTIAADIDGEAVVWRQTASTRLDIEDWVILATTDHKNAHIVASNTEYYKTDSPPLFNPDHHPLAVVGDQVFWSVVDWPTARPESPKTNPGKYPGRQTYRVLRRSISGKGPVREVAEGAYGPSGAHDRLVYIDDARLRTGRNSGEVRIMEMRESNSGQEIHSLGQLTKGAGIPTACGGEGYTAWIRSRSTRAELEILLEGGDQPRRVPLETTASAATLACGDGFVTWGRDRNRALLHDIPSGKTTVLQATASSSQPLVAGHMVAWPGAIDQSRGVQWSIGTWTAFPQ
ncbi:hypothetical protein [Kribbia dieselivorans]|uniref:hypothetical protein n=1 Tax=Kribbia dieselivorans TaxID=331526 RepID=UPI0012ECC976|nr:hypothetical protein [Kribbia dieselivorans]